MSARLELQANMDIILQSIEEVHALLSMLEAQVRSGLSATQPEVELAELTTLEIPSLILEGDASLLD